MFGFDITVIAVILGLALLALVGGLARRARGGPGARVMRMFGLQGGDWQVVGGDIRGIRPRVFLRSRSVTGAPDAVFRCHSRGLIVVGELKSRRYRGRLRWREYFQVQLYAHLARRRWRRWDVLIRLRFADAIVDVAPDAKVAEALENLAPELRSARANWTPERPTPLQERREQLALPTAPPVQRVRRVPALQA